MKTKTITTPMATAIIAKVFGTDDPAVAQDAIKKCGIEFRTFHLVTPANFFLAVGELSTEYTRIDLTVEEEK